MHKKVPILIRNGKPVCESQIIMQYIDDVYGGTGASLLPANPYERAMARFWAAFIDDKVIALPLLSLHFQFVSISSVQIFMLTDVCVYCSSWLHGCRLAGERLWRRRWRG
jgi:hypothetical protein